LPIEKPVRERDAPEPHLGFDEQRQETGLRSRLRHRYQAKDAANSDSLDLWVIALAADSALSRYLFPLTDQEVIHIKNPLRRPTDAKAFPLLYSSQIVRPG
jgi:hypothetical protein